jgi:hypothetical protein
VVVFATNYNATDPKFITKTEMDSYEFANSTVPTDGMLHPIECAKSQQTTTTKFVRTRIVPEDPLLYDVGKFQVATKGMQSSYTIGELWVTYHVRLSKPRLPVRGLTNYWIGMDYAGNVTAAAPFGNLEPVSGNTLDIEFIPPASLVMRTPGRFICVVTHGALVGTTVGFGLASLGTNVTAPVVFPNGGVEAIALTVPQAVWASVLEVNDNIPSIQNIVNFAGMTNTTAGNVMVQIAEELIPTTTVEELNENAKLLIERNKIPRKWILA